MPAMQRFVTVIPAGPDGTSTLIWSMFGTSAAVSAVPSGGKSQHLVLKATKGMAVPEVIAAQ
jgi:hypothetical protein